MAEEISYIEYNGINHPTRELIFEDEVCLIATEALDNEIFVEGTYPDDTAIRIDEKIIFYVKDEEITMPDDYLSDILRHNISQEK